MSYYEYCPNCFSPSIYEGVCSSCGYDQNVARKYDSVLPPMTVLNDKYVVGRVLGRGGFGVTYIGKSMSTGRTVAIKECMPERYCERDEHSLRLIPKDESESAFVQCKEKLREEIAALYELSRNSFVVDIYEYFSENNTEYLVMEYINGVTLKFLTQKAGGKTSLENATHILFTIGSALMGIHEHGIIHRDISPENIMIAEHGEIKLIDFGASKKVDSFRDDVEAVFIKQGFAPPEQYDSNGEQGPWTDVYALAATFYTIVSGQPLIDALYRKENDSMKPLSMLDCGVPDYVSTAISKAMALDYHERYSSVSELFNDIAKFAESASQIDDSTLSLVKEQRKHESRVGKGGSIYSGIKYPYVEVISGEFSGEKILIPDYGFVSLGRVGGEADLAVGNFAMLSRIHCLVGYDRSKNRFIVIDKSANGTYYSNNNRMLVNAESFIKPNEEFFICSPSTRIRVILS